MLHLQVIDRVVGKLNHTLVIFIDSYWGLIIDSVTASFLIE